MFDLFLQIRFLSQCHNTTVFPLVIKNEEALPCLATVQKWQGAFVTNHKQKDSKICYWDSAKLTTVSIHKRNMTTYEKDF